MRGCRHGHSAPVCGEGAELDEGGVNRDAASHQTTLIQMGSGGKAVRVFRLPAASGHAQQTSELPTQGQI